MNLLNPDTVPNQTTPPIDNKNHILIVVIFAIIVFSLASISLTFLKSRRTPQTLPQIFVPPIATVSPVFPSLTPVPETASVEYLPRQKIFKTINIPGELDGSTFDFYKVGRITSGKYQGADLILSLVVFDGPCKGRGCGSPTRIRYLHHENSLVFLPRISLTKYWGQKDYELASSSAAQYLSLAPQTDLNFTLPSLEYLEKITLASPSAELKYPWENDGQIDLTRLDFVYRHSSLGNIYTTKTKFSPQAFFYYPAPDKTLNLFDTNAFFIFRPDGTYIRYSYTPPFSSTDIIWGNITPTPTPKLFIDSNNLYIYQTLFGCEGAPYDNISVISPDRISSADLIPTGKVPATGDVIYTLSDPNHKLNRELYSQFLSYRNKLIAESELYKDYVVDKTYAEFLQSRPLFFWQDPFGRLIRFINPQFTVSLFCEPIIYFYPPSTQKISVKLGQSVHVSDSTPSYSSGWEFVADSDGHLSIDNQSYPYLFWEGWSYILPPPNRGFVVSKTDVPEFFQEKLSQLGLNPKESADFQAAWLPKFSDSPYYLISFINQKVIDQLAPLEISPPPDTVIRILMDYLPLDKPVEISPPALDQPAPRRGFTVVEWGGIKR